MNTNNQSSQRSRLSRSLSTAISAALSLAAASAAHGGPQGGVVTSGDAAISTPDLNLTQIDQGSHSASIDWQSFDVAAQEQVIFNQPSASAVALNRILTQDPSQIHGSISANGRVFLINPNGIIFGATSRINVGSLVASSLDITDVDAATGRYTFNTAAQQSGAINNSGQITAADGGSVTLLGGSVVNNGLIVADYGSVNLGAGRAATLHFDGDGLVRFQIDTGLLPNASGAGAAVDNAGEILADGGQVLLTARAASDVVARAVNNDGVIRAARVENVGGRIRLVGPEGTVVNNGTLDAAGVGAGTGGEVQVLGNHVELAGASLVDVSGSAGGGTALIGGSFRGEDTSVFNAQQTNVQAGAVIKANSTLSGDAGQVAVWADGTTTFDGNIFARAMGSDGNGGYAEVSGKEHLRIGGHAWLESANGSAGTLLLDPGSVTITNGGSSGPPATMDTFNDGWINGQLNGSNLTISTANSTDGATENLTVDSSADISWNDTTTLTLIGGNSVSVQGTITNSDTGPLVLRSSSGAISIGGVLSLDGNLTVDAGTNITQSAAVTVGGNLDFLAGGGITQSAALDVTGTSDFTAGNNQSVLLNDAGNTFTGAVTIGASSGNLQNVSLSDTSALSLQPLTVSGDLTAVSGGTLNLQALMISGDLDATGNSITQTGALSVTGTSSFMAADGQSITLGTPTNSFGAAVSFAADTGTLQNVTVADATALALQPLTIDGNLTATSGGALTLQSLTIGGNLDVTGSTISQTGALTVTGASDFTAADNQSITLNSANAFTGAVGFASSGAGNLLDITLNNSTALELGALDIAGNLSVTSAGTITQSGTLSVGGSSSFTATVGQSVLLDDAANSFGSAINFAPSSGVGHLLDVTVADTTALDLQPLTIDGNLTATSGGALTLQALTIGGNLDVTGNTISQAGALTVTGTSDFTAADNQSITLNSANAFAGAVSFASSGPGNLQDVTLNNSTALELGALDITGNLSVTSTGTITQSGALSVDGDSIFTAALGQSVLLDNAGNDFTGAVSIVGSGGNLQDVTLQDSTAIELQTLSLGGDLSVTAGGDITQSGALIIIGDSSFTSADGQSIRLENAANSFGGSVSFAAASGNLADVAVTDITALDLQTPAIDGNLTASSGGALNLQALTVGGNLDVTGLAITQTGALDITGTSSFTAAGGQSIALGNAANSLGGAVTFAASSGNLQNLTVTDTTALDLQPLTITGTLTAVSGGALNLQALTIFGNLDATGNAITQTGALGITGTSSFTAASAQSIAVGNATNSFGGAVTFAASSGNLQNVTVGDVTALDLQPLTITGTLTAVSGGALSLQALTIGGNLDATGNSITQTGALTVSGTSDFTAADGQSVVLNNPGNAFTGAVSFASSGLGNLLNVTLNNSTALELQALTIDGNLAVVAGGAITQSGALDVGGASSFTADDGESVVLDDVDNDFTGVVSFLSGGPGNLQDVTVSDSTALALQALTIDGNLRVTSGGAITQSGDLIVGGTSNFEALAGQSIVLDRAGNSFASTVSVAASSPGNLQNVTLRDSTALDLQALSLDGDLSVNAAAISQSGALSVGGTASFVAAAGQSVVLNNASNDFVGGVSLAASGVGSLQNVALRDSTALDLQSLAVAGNLSVTADSITQSGALSVGGAASFAAGAGESIVLNDAGNLFGGAVNFASTGLENLQDVVLRDSTALDLQALTVDGDLTVTASGAISQSGSLGVGGAAAFRTLNDVGAGITLDGTNSFGSVQAAVRNGADSANAAASIAIHESDDTLLGDVQTGAGQGVSIVSAGAIEALANTSITTSSASLNAAGDIGATMVPLSLVLSNGSISADSPGSIYLTNAGGIGPVALDHLAAGGAGAIDFESDGDIEVSDVQAGSSVTLASTGGSILDDNVDGAGSQIVTDALSLTVAGAIGEAAGVGNGTLDLQAGSVSASAQSGAVYLDDTDGDINIRQVSAGGPVWIQAAGSILDDPSDGSPASISSAAGGVQLSAVDNIGTVTDMLTRQGTAITVDTNGGTLSAHVASATGQINLDIADGSNPVAGAGAIRAGGAGRLLIQSAGDMSLTSFSSAVSGFAEAGFSADGTLQLSALPGLLVGSFDTLLLRGGTDISSATRVLEIGAGHLIFESGGQGGNITLNTSVDRLDASIGNGASLIVDEGSGDITLGTITAGGDVSISARNILDDGDLNGVTRVTAGDAVSLTASTAIGGEDGSGGGRIDTAGGSVSVSSDAGPVFISHSGDVQVSGEARGGLIDIVAPTGAITVNGVLRASGPLTLTAGTNAAGADPAIAGNIALTGSAQSDGTVVLSARGGGAITDASGTATHLSAAGANLTATRIGSQANRLNVDVDSLNAIAPGGIYADAANAIELRSITAQTVAISAVGNITDDGDAQTRITADSATLSGSALGATGAGNEIDTAVDSLSASASAGGIHIGELDSIELTTVNASGAGNDIVIAASGAITDDGDDTTRIGGGSLTLTASAIGAAGANGELDTQATSLTASASDGGIFIGEADDLQLKAITADAGNDVAISAGGALADDGNDATRVTADNVFLSASTIGAAGNRVDTAAAVLSATSTAGGIYIDERDSVSLAAVQASGAGNTVDLRTANNGNIIVQNVTTQGGAVNLAAGGTGSLNVTGAIESNNGVVNLTAGNALAVPGLSTGTGSVVLHTVNDLNVGTITAGSISITSDTGNVSLGTVNAGTGTASITADNGTISDGTETSLTAGRATLSARSIGTEDNPLNIAAGTLTATTSAGGVFVEETDGLTVAGISSAGRINLVTGGALMQGGAMTSAGNAIDLSAGSIDMLATATTDSAGGDITYVANSGDATLGVLNAGTGRVLTIAADNVFSVLDPTAAVNNITASAVEIRAGGMGGGLGEIGTASNPLTISTPAGATRSVFLVVPLVNGIQTSTPRINYSGPSSSLLLKGYSGDSGALFFDQSSAFTVDTVLGNGESIVPLLNGRIAINNDSLRAARQALSSGVVSTVSVDWAAFDPDVSLFGTLDPPLRLPADQIDEADL